MTQDTIKIIQSAVVAVLSTDGIPVKVFTGEDVVDRSEKYIVSDPEVTQYICYMDFFDAEGNPVGSAEKDGVDEWTFVYKGP